MTVQQEKLLGEKTLKVQQLEQEVEGARKTLVVREEEVREWLHEGLSPLFCVCVHVCVYMCVCICVCVVGQESNITGGDRSWLRADQRAAQDQ